ncbi:MAG: NTP transferase domain-containing protein [Sulfurospirillum sp.]|nr:NTP transferase domain-containing protein [Sulfurospirillum sp.]
MKAVVMAGGFGTRIQPLTHSRPKPMLPIMNKPMMEHTMMMLKNLGISEFIVLLYFKPEIIKDYFKDGSDFGIKITYVLPDDDYGTAGAVKLAQEYIGNENFIIISGDLVTDFDFQKLFDFHANANAKLSIGLTSVENPLQFGVVIANEDNVIEKFLEKPSWGEVFSDTINTGIYIIEPEILEYIPKNENYDFGKDLFPKLMKNGVTLMGFTLNGYWRDVGNPESYREVYEDILNKRIKFDIDGEKSKYPDGVLYTSESYKLDKSIEIVGTVMLGKNVSIENGVRLNNVIVGDNVTIKKNCKLRNSVLWDYVAIDKNTTLDNSVICNNNIIGKNVSIKAGLILAEGCEIGELASFERDVTIWPDKQIQAASIVSNNIVLGSRYKNSIFENGTVIGTSNIELSCEMVTKLGEAFAAQLPIGTVVIVGRDEDKNSRMLKRAFLGGLLSAGINVVDIKNIPQPVMRHTLANDETLNGGIHFKRSAIDTTHSEITFFNDQAIRINSSMAKSIEKAFFTEKFRRVDYKNIGKIFESPVQAQYSAYKMMIEKTLDYASIKHNNFRVALDLMHGSSGELLPTILNELGIENVILNTNYDEQKLSNMKALQKRSQENIAKIVVALGYNLGVVIYPNIQRITLVSDNGEVLDKIKGLYSVLCLVNADAKGKELRKVFLPTWAPDIIYFENLIIERGKYADFTLEQLKQYDLIATMDGNFSFKEFSYTRDGLYATLKIMQLLCANNLKLSDVAKEIDYFYYKSFKIDCVQSLKGKMMRKFLESAKNKKSSLLDGVKIWENETDWILMIPDQYGDFLNIYMQAKNDESGALLYEKYTQKIEKWMKE